MATPMDSEEVTMKVNRRDLECSLCLEMLVRPRSLPCLHTFCEDCLSQHIAKNVFSTRSFLCPLCRKETIAVNESSDRKLWAKDFPMNSFLSGMSQGSSRGQGQTARERSPVSSLCNPCKKKRLETGAVYWCSDMRSAFCEECKTNYHDLLHDGCDLKMTSELTQTQFDACQRHNIPMDFFCEDHESLYCSKCVALHHRHCVSVVPARVYCQTLRVGPAITNMNNSLQKALRTVNIIIDGSSDQMHNLDLGKSTALNEIRNIRSDINTYLDDLQTSMEQEVVQIHQQEHAKLNECLMSHTSLKDDITDLKNAFECRQTMKDDRQVISLHQQGKTLVEKCCQMVERARTQWQVKTVKHMLDFDPNNLDNYFSLGEITTSTVTRNLPINDSLDLLFSRLKVTRQSNFKIQLPWETDCHATGVLYMSDGHIIVADQLNKNLKMFAEDGECVHYLSFRHAPWGICHHSEGQVAISMTGCNLITVARVRANTLEILDEVDIQKRRNILGTCTYLKEDVQNKGNIFGISYLDGTFYLTSDQSVNPTKPIDPQVTKHCDVFEHKYSMYSVKMDTRTISPVSPPLMLENSCYYMVYDHQRKDLILSLTNKSRSNIAICRSSLQGKLQKVAKADILKGTHGIDIDKEGNIYACGKSSNNIVQMSSTGERTRELLTAEDGVRCPLDISVLDHRFAVTFDSWDRRNQVYIYHMGV